MPVTIAMDRATGHATPRHLLSAMRLFENQASKRPSPSARMVSLQIENVARSTGSKLIPAQIAVDLGRIQHQWLPDEIR